MIVHWSKGSVFKCSTADSDGLINREKGHHLSIIISSSDESRPVINLKNHETRKERAGLYIAKSGNTSREESRPVIYLENHGTRKKNVPASISRKAASPPDA